jgi:hypothetical protein
MNDHADNVGFTPLAGEESFMHGDGMDGIQRLVSLPERTCTRRAALRYLQAIGETKRKIELRHAQTFNAAIEHVRRDTRAALLIPEQHELQQQLSHDPTFEHIASQHFELPNPGLHVATPGRNTSDRTYLWTLPALYPLVKEQYGDVPPFEEIIDAISTQEAALQCGKIFGGGFCVTNDDGLHAFQLTSTRRLRNIVMKWFLYRKAR